MIVDRRVFFEKIIYLFYFLLLFILVKTFLTIRFEENDDVIMLLISSGKYSGTPDNHLVFINFIVGSFLNLFYNIFPTLEWYTILFVGLNIVSFSLISRIVLKSTQSNLYKVVVLLLLTSFFIYFSTGLQFTRVSATLSIAGLCIIYSSTKKIIGAIMLLIGSLLRFEASMLILILSLPLFIPSTLHLKEYFQDRKIKALIVTALICTFCKTLDYIYYQLDADWKYYKEYNQVRGKINDNPNTLNIKNINLPAGISKNEYKLLLRTSANPNIITLDNLIKIHQSIENKNLIHKLKNINNILEYKNYLLLFLFLTILYSIQDKKNRFKFALLFIAFITLISFITLNGTLKERVFFPAVFGVTLFFIVLNEKQQVTATKLIHIVIIIFSITILNKAYNLQKQNKEIRMVFNQQTNMINRYVKEGKKLIPIGASYKIEYGDPFHSSSNFPSQKVFFGGWLTYIPLHKGKFDNFNFFINNYGLFTPGEETVDLISNSIFSEYGVKVAPSIVAQEIKQNHPGKYYNIIELRTGKK